MTTDRSRCLAAVMFTDVVGYTAVMQEDEEAARVIRKCHREALEAALATHGGELVQYLGDGSLSTFPSTVRAVSAAVDIQQALREHVPLRVGVHQGEIAFDDQGIYGDSVNVAARVMALGTAGSIIVSDKAQAELVNQRDFTTASLGQFHLKNVKLPPTIYAIEGHGLTVPSRDELLPLSESTAAFKAVASHWPKIALGMLTIAILLGTTVGDSSTSVPFQSYVFAWATVTAALWFLFDKAEEAMSSQSRVQVAGWLREANWQEGLRSLPDSFAVVFDRVFGERHLSLRCFLRSCFASLISVLVMLAIWSAIAWPKVWLEYEGGRSELMQTNVDVSWVALLGDGWRSAGSASGVVLLLAILMNLVPDFLSLLETRLVLRWMRRGKSLLRWLLLDIGLTGIISAGLMLGMARVVFFDPISEPPVAAPAEAWGKWYGNPEHPRWQALADVLTFSPSIGRLSLPVVPLSKQMLRIEFSEADTGDANLGPILSRLGAPSADSSVYALTQVRPFWQERFFFTWPWDYASYGELPFSLFFYSAFFTSVWLWLYAASVVVSRILLKMNSGVGFLLRVTDVERQPFRSMGFVSVIIVSVLFALGLPLVLL